MLDRKGALGFFRLTRTRWSSSGSTVATSARYEAHLLLPPKAMIRSKDHFTSAAFTSRPLWYFTPRRRWKT